MKLSNIELEQDKYYFLSPFGIGDTIILCGFQKEIEKKLKGKICFIIKPSHKIIMDLYKIKDFILLDSNARYNLASEELKILSEKNPYPIKGQIYVAHCLLHSQFKDIIEQQYAQKVFSFSDWYRYFWGLDWNTELYFPTDISHIQTDSRLDLDYKKTVLLIPEAHTITAIKTEFWQKLAEYLKGQDLVPVTATNDEYKIPGVKNIDLNLDDLVALALNCHSVYSLRNGLCDLINFKENLWVIYPDTITYNFNRLKTIFKNSKAHEVIWSKDYVF